jgi:Na+/H+ antiporter NhaD/arsenite permease-like protein
VSRIDTSPGRLLAVIIAIVALLAAVLSNDVICFAVSPVLIEGCLRRNLNPLPFLLALACAANIGSAATLIGNPQNILIGQSLDLSFAAFFAQTSPPIVLSLAGLWGLLCLRFRGRWRTTLPAVSVDAPAFNRWQTAKGLLLLAVLVAAFVLAPWPRDILALGAAGFLLMSRRMATRSMLALVDWHVLVLFIGLFVVHHAAETAGMVEHMLGVAQRVHLDLEQPAWLFAATVILSNLVSNVPAIMLLLQAPVSPLSGPLLALASTFAGNLLIIGSIANIIVVDQAARLNIRINWSDHAKTGIPVTLFSLFCAAAWLWFLA